MSPTGAQQRRLTTGGGCYALPVWSPDGKRIAFEYNPSANGRFAGDSDIYVVSADGKSPPRRLTNARAFDGDPAWSPDGKKIVFESTRTGNPEIWTMNADGTHQARLTRNPAFDGDPAWSPGGKRIAFTSTRDGNREIYLMNPDGSSLLNITNNPAADFDPNWSPTGEFVAFTSDRDRNDEIYETNDRFILKRLTNNLASDMFPAFSPDGKQIVFTSDRGSRGNRDVYAMSSDGSDVRRLTRSPGWDEAPDWQPVGPRALPVPKPVALPAPAGPAKLAGLDLRPAVACQGKTG
jgi:Tol biopolymer transport system component